MVFSIRSATNNAVIVGAIIVVAVFPGCQDYRNAFNPVQLLCPGDFSPGENQCVIQTRDSVEP